MAYPNIGSVEIAAACTFTGATPPVVTKAVNTVGVVRTAEGIWVWTIGEAIDILHRWSIPVINDAAWGTIQLNPAVQTDLTIGMLSFDTVGGIVAGDTDQEVICFRAHIL
jgi:hypothetical protein